MKLPDPRAFRSLIFCVGLVLLTGCLSTPLKQPVTGDPPAPSGGIDWAAAGDEAVRILQGYLRVDTSNAPGVSGASGNVRGTADLLEGLLRKEGIECQRVVHPQDPSRVVLMGRLRGDGSGGKPLLLEHHMDVVPAEGEWSHPPFGGEVHDGWIYGRGSEDDKGLGVLHLMAVLLLKRHQVPLARDVIFQATPDEEIGGERGVTWMVKNHWDLLDPAVVLEEGGSGSEGRYRKGLAFDVQVAQKRVFWVELLAKGEGGHGSVPRENALVVLERAVARVLAMERKRRITPVVASAYDVLAQDPSAARRLMDTLVSDPIEEARLMDTISLTRMQGSDKVNTQPREARASLDIRLLPDTDPDRFLDGLRRAIGDDRVSIREIQSREEVGAPSPIDSIAYRAIREAVERAYPEAIALPSLSTGGTDAQKYRARGVPAYGFSPFITPEGEHPRLHDVDERVRVDELRKGVRMMFEVVRDIAARK